MEQTASQSCRPTYNDSSIEHEGYSSLPEAVQQFDRGSWKQMIRASDAGKEVGGAEGKELAENFAYGLPLEQRGYNPAQDVFNREAASPNLSSREKFLRILGRVCAVVVILIVLGVALGLGLGLGLNSKHNAPAESAATSTASPDPKPTTVSNINAPQYLSTRGAFNGTGISVQQQPVLFNLTTGERTNDTYDEGNLLLVFQHHTGQIRWMQRAYPDNWYGGSEYDVVATDAKNSTPITILWSVLHEFHVFYISKDNRLRQRFIDNQTFTWFDGPLNDLDIKTFDSDAVGMQACFYQGPIDNVDTDNTNNWAGIRVFVATDATTFNQYAWRPGLSGWVLEQSWFDLNGHSTPACYGWLPNWVTYVMFVDTSDTGKLYWKDTTNNIQSNATHPLNTWVLSSLTFPGVAPNTGLSFHTNLYGVMSSSGDIKGWSMNFDAENTKIIDTTTDGVFGKPAVPNSHIYAWSNPPMGYPTKAGQVHQTYMFCQTVGDDITLYTADPDTGEWTPETLPIPDE